MTELSPELQSELVEFVRSFVNDDNPRRHRNWMTWACELLAKLSPPADPDIEEARKIAAEICLSQGNSIGAELYLDGRWDREPIVQSARKAIRRGRELERLSSSVRHPSPVETAAALRELERSGK